MAPTKEAKVSDYPMLPKNARVDPKSATILEPAPASPDKAMIETNLELVPLAALGPNIYTNARPLWQPAGARGIYGGSVISQSLLAACETVPGELHPNSMHCYFVLAGASTKPVLYHVNPIRSGRSFATRHVEAKQEGKTIFISTSSFQRPVDKERYVKTENGDGGVVTHGPPMPAGVPKPEECPTNLDRVEAFVKAGQMTAEIAERWRKRIEKDPIEWRHVENEVSLKALEEGPIHERKLRHWFRAKAGKGEMHPNMHICALAYASDSWFIGTTLRVHPDADQNKLGMMVSLDHSLWFHGGAETKFDEWHLAEMWSEWSGEERSVVQMRIWNQKGELVATARQEGLLRMKDGRTDDGAREPKPSAKSKI